MPQRRNPLLWVLVTLAIVLALPMIGYLYLIESMFGVHKTGFKPGLTYASDHLFQHPRSERLVDVYCQSAGPDGTLFIRSRISASDVQGFVSQDAFRDGWAVGKAFDRALPWKMKRYWRDLWRTDPQKCRRWVGVVRFRRHDGTTEDWPASIVIRPDQPGTMVVYFVYNSA